MGINSRLSTPEAGRGRHVPSKIQPCGEGLKFSGVKKVRLHLLIKMCNGIKQYGDKTQKRQAAGGGI